MTEFRKVLIRNKAKVLQKTEGAYNTGIEPKINVYYDGRYPNLCSGNLTVVVANITYTFPSYAMCSGGSAGVTNEGDDFCTTGEWSIDSDSWPDDFPEQYKSAVLRAINEQVPHGCCGGCI